MDAISVDFLSGVGVLVVQKLVAFLEQEAQLVLGSNIGADLRFVKDEIESATALLKDMSPQLIMEEYTSSEQLKQWLMQVKDLICEAEDAIYESNYHIATCNKRGNMFQQLSNLKAHRRIASHLRNLKLKASEVRERRERYNFGLPGAAVLGAKPVPLKTSANSLLYDPWLSAFFVESDQLVGIAEQQDTITRWLAEDDDMPQLRVVSVVGSGGMGKTTLATQCYKSLTVTRRHFSCCALVTLSQSFDLDKLLRSLNKQLFGAVSEAQDAEELVMEIRSRLKDERYLVLLDDVWTVDAWTAFGLAFPDNGNGSRIIVTTRVDTVANACSSRDPRCPHNPTFVTPAIQGAVLQASFLCASIWLPPYSHELMEGILKRCGGMPLAIVTVAGILVSHSRRIISKEQWQRVHDGIGHEWEAGTRNMKRILMLSYNDLPNDIKPCFLYLSMFPEDWKIKRSDLMRRWIAEGLVGGRRDVAEQIAKSYFSELVNRNLIDPAVVSCGEVKRWKVHNLILEIIVRKTSDENFVCVIDKDFARREPQQVNSNIRRIFVHEQVILSSGLKSRFVRSLSLNFALVKRAETMENIVAFKDLRLLRMLDLEECRFIQDHHVELICDKLRLLKHLCLKSTGFSKLPESVKMLQDLEVLDIRKSHVEELPGSLVNLRRLSHLYTSSTSMIDSKPVEMKLPTGIGSMESLRVLEVALEFDISILEELGQLMQLNKLHIKLLPWSSYKIAYLPALSNYSLRSLRISSLARIIACNLDFLNDLSSPSLKLETLKLEVKLSVVPRWFESLHHLTKLSLLLSHVEDDDIRRLGRLPSLLILHLTVSSRYVDDEREISIGPEGFANLRILSLEFTGRRANARVKFQQGALPNLVFLDLKYKWIDENAETTSGVGNLAKLKEIAYSVSKSNPRNANYGLRRAMEAHANRPRLTITEII